MKKIIGYVLILVGLVGVALSYKTIRESVNLTIPAALNDNYIIGIGALLIILGAFIGLRSGSSKKQEPEVPIYHGKNVVGYRRVK